ncbi:MAG: ABC transporter substrate-binding protein [Anaerolineae bacterium]|nr:ABC transporter substrate-binding protein [Anaerolineae bacterium]
MKIKLLLVSVLAVALAVPMLASPVRAQGEGAVDIIAWAGYIERGETDPAYDWVTSFEAETGCKVNVQVANSSDEMVTLMTEGKYDLVTASGDASLRLIAGETVQPVDLSKIPTYASVDERLQGAPWYTVDGKAYGVPYQWGANVLMYNKAAFSEAPTSWSVVFEEQQMADGKSNKGRVQAYYGTIAMADAALYLSVKNPELGITDPYELDQKQFDAVVELLKQQRELVARYWTDATSQIDDFTNEDIIASASWPYQVNVLAAAHAGDATLPDIASVVPAEGATGWADTTMLGAQAPHPNCAYLWMEHSLQPKVQGDVAAWFGSVPVNPAACEGNDLLGAEGCKTNGIESFDQIKFWKTPVKECGDDRGDVCIPYADWVTAYIAVKG